MFDNDFEAMGVNALAAVPIGYTPALTRVQQLPPVKQDIAALYPYLS